MKKIAGICLIALLMLGIVFLSECTSSPSKEVVLKEIDVASLSSEGVFGSQKAIVDIPDNATKVRVVYALTAKDRYGMGSNGNMGVNHDNINENSGENVISWDNHYIEAGPGKTIQSEFTSTGHGAFYYTGSFGSGTITVYATLPG